MSKKPILVVMAAGMGSRYGGLKQLDPVDQQGHIIMDFSVYDAVRAGFGKVVFVIKKEHEADFRNKIVSRMEPALGSRGVQLEIAFQDTAVMPAGREDELMPLIPEERIKPWGTAHAVMCAGTYIDAPFAVINADDYYGPTGFKLLADFLTAQEDKEKEDKAHYAMVGFELGKTVTDHGYVSRGVCEVDDDGYLIRVTERVHIEKQGDGIAYTENDGADWCPLDPGGRVSMNLWGFTEDFMAQIETDFAHFLKEIVPANPLKAECYLPAVVSGMIDRGQADVTVLPTPDKWYGVTYREDKPVVEAAIESLKHEGLYPQELFAVNE